MLVLSSEFEDHRSPNLHRQNCYFIAVLARDTASLTTDKRPFLSSDPGKRPSFRELLDRFRDVQKRYSLQAQMQQSLRMLC